MFQNCWSHLRPAPQPVAVCIISGDVVARIPLTQVDDMTPQQRAQYDRFPSNLSRALLLADDRLASALPNLANALRAAGLDPALREAAILHVAALTGSAYERMQHLGQAEKAGLDPATIAAIEAGDTTALSPTMAATLAFVAACVAAPRVPEEVFAAAQAVLSSRDLVTVILLVGHYTMIGRLLATLDVELDPAPDGWASEH